MCAAIKGDTIENNLPQKEATPDAVPRMGAGNASGVQPYNTALNMLARNQSQLFRLCRRCETSESSVRSGMLLFSSSWLGMTHHLKRKLAFEKSIP